MFHSVIAATEKDRSPRVLKVLMEGCSRRMALADLRVRDGLFTFISWMMYSGAEELMAL